MKVTYVIAGLSTGGAEMMLLKLLQNIDRNQFTLTVISLTTIGEIGLCIEKLRVPVHALGMKSVLISPIKFIELIRLLRKFRPDVVHCWMYHADLLGGSAARIAGIKNVTWGIRQSNLSSEHNKCTTLILVKICALVSGWLPTRILTCSQKAQIIHVAAGYRADKMVLISNGFDLSRFHPNTRCRDTIRTELGLVSSVQLVGLVARYDPQKNHMGFIEVAALVHKSHPHVHFVLAGTAINWENKVLKALIVEKGLADHVHLLGRREDMPRLMASFDLLASSSYGEAFPNVLGEAMACGVPCVVTDVGDSAEIVGDTGRVVDAGDMAGLARHLIELLQWPTEKRTEIGALARQRIRDRYEIGKITRCYEEFYSQINKGNV